MSYEISPIDCDYPNKKVYHTHLRLMVWSYGMIVSTYNVPGKPSSNVEKQFVDYSSSGDNDMLTDREHSRMLISQYFPIVPITSDRSSFNLQQRSSNGVIFRNLLISAEVSANCDGDLSDHRESCFTKKQLSTREIGKPSESCRRLPTGEGAPIGAPSSLVRSSYLAMCLMSSMTS